MKQKAGIGGEAALPSKAKTRPVTVWLEQDLCAAVEAAAEQDQRSTSSMIRRVLSDWRKSQSATERVPSPA